MSSGNKFARATGRGQFRPPPNRGLVPLRHGQASSKRTPLGHGKDATGSASAGNGGIANISREESFQLMPDPSTIGPPFAMVIRLQPEILEELKQAEADGIEPEMKFGTNALGHVIQVGTETFKFQSAPEPGHLCDIYEQRKGESGEAVLVEAGSAWRKLSVLRILSATEKDRVKKRTAEAEKKQRQRKSILVDPSTQIIIPQAATAEANGRKPLPKLTKEPPPKKRKVTMSPIKQNTHTSSTVATGNHQFSSPASPSFEPPAIQARGPHTNQMADVHPSKARAVPERIVAPPLANKGPAIQKDKTRTPAAPAAPAAPDTGKSGLATNMTDLRNFLIGLLQENPKGVTIKAIEKAVAEGLPAIPEKKVLEKVLKSIASFHAPGKYVLISGVEKGNFFDSAPPTSSGRAQEAVRSSIHEDKPSSSIPEREAAKEKKEPVSSDRGLSNVVTHHLEHSTKEASPELAGAQLFDSNTHDDLPKQDAAHVSKDPSTGGSESSSSSGSGSASDSDSDSSGSGSGTDSGSGSGSDSASSSSSGASMDEDVDIMSDDDVEKKSDAKQKPTKVRESKLIAKEDVKVQEKSNFKDEGYENSIPLNRLEPVPTLDQDKDRGSDARAKVSENVIENVFGRDEASDSDHDNLGQRVRGEKSSHIKSANFNYGERKTSVKTQNSRESRERNTFDEAQRSATRDGEALGLDEELDLLVDKVSDFKEMDNSSLVGNRVGFPSAQQEHHKPPLKSAGLGITKDIDKKRADAESISRPNLDRRERDVYDIRGAPKNPSSSLEMSKMLPEGSPMDLGDHVQNVAKAPPENLSQKQQASSEAKRATSKKPTARESHEKFERAKASEIVAKGKSPSNMARASHGTANASEGSMKLDDERGVPVDRISDRGGAETSDLLEAKQHKKERGAEERMSDSAKFGDISGRQSRDFETQHWQQKDGSGHLGPSKLNLHRVSKESNHSGGGHDRDSPHVDRSNKVLKLSRQKGESFERAGLIVEQAERPLTDIESTKRGKDISGKGTLKEAESGGRLSGGEPSNLPSKDASRFATVYGDSGHSSYSHSRSQTRENPRIVSQVAELRDPPFENGSFESRKLPHMEESRSKATSGATSRVLQKGSLSPDQDDMDRRPLDMSKQSPVKATNDSKHYAYDSRSGKRRPEEIESAEMERSKKRASAAHIKQQPQKEEWFPTGFIKQNHTEKGRFSTSDSQEYASVRSDEEMEELYRQQKVSQTRASSSEFRREHFKAGDSLDTTKRHTPQSNDDEVCEFFAPYEKKKPELRGLINTFQEYKEYSKEYHEKYPIYIQLNRAIEQQKKPFESFKKDMERAKFKDDKKKLDHTGGKVRKEYTLRRKNCKRMVHTFRILHEELKVIKTRCKEYAEKVGERISINNPKYTPL